MSESDRDYQEALRVARISEEVRREMATSPLWQAVIAHIERQADAALQDLKTIDFMQHPQEARLLQIHATLPALMMQAVEAVEAAGDAAIAYIEGHEFID